MIIGHTLLGNGAEKVVVLHGWFGDHTVFAPLFPMLDLDTFTYAFIDYRGYGKSKGMQGKYSMQEISADIVALVDSLHWDRFHLLGHSMGGFAMQHVMLAVAPRSRVKTLVGIGPVPASAYPLDVEAQVLFSDAISDDEARYAILDFTTGHRHSATWLNYMVERSHATTTPAAYAAYLSAWTSGSIVEALQGLEIPVLVCIGEYDLAFTPVFMSTTWLSWFPNAALVIIPNAGHYPMQETPVHLVTCMESFLKRNA